MKLNFDCSLLYSDTDALLYEIRGADFYQKVAKDSSLKQHFDFSNYPQDHFLYNTDNKMVTLKFKEETKGSAIREFVGLKAKMYSIVYENKQKMSAKGVCRFAQTSLNHDVYRDVLINGSLLHSTNIRIGARNHAIQTVENRKISLAAFDDKRFILDDGVTCLPFGHFEIRDLDALREIAADDNWGDDESVALTQPLAVSSPTWSQIVNNFNVSPPSNVPSLTNFNANDCSDYFVVSETLNPLSPQIFSPPDPGFHQRQYYDSELDEVVDFDEETTEYSTPRQRNPFIDDQAEEVNDSFLMSDSDSATIDYYSRSESASLFEPQCKRRRVVISSDSE